jgi:hypothetical protein
MTSGDYIWCPQKVGKAIQSLGIVPAGALSYHYGFRTILRYNLFIFVDDSIQRLVPRYTLPFTLALITRTLERVFDTVRVINELQVSQPLATHSAAVAGNLRVSFKLDNASIFNMD